MKTKILLLLGSVFLSLQVNAQLKIHDNGKVTIGGMPLSRPNCQVFVNGITNGAANGPNGGSFMVQHNNVNWWSSAIGATVPIIQNASYNLWCSGLGGMSFYVTGDGWVWANTYATMSDSTLKKNIARLNDPLTMLSRLHGYSFNFKPYNVTKGFDSGHVMNPACTTAHE
jgi:hypothetical protein